MSLTSNRNIDIINDDGTNVTSETFSASANTSAPRQEQIVALASGNNTITVPTGGTVPTACTIVPPTANTTALTYKGVTGDTGTRLHNTDPSSIALHSSVTTFVLNAGAIMNVRLIWS